MWLPFDGKSRLAPESVYLYTLHKCASSLFSGYVLRNVRGLEVMDYEHQYHLGLPLDVVRFEERGYVYGPIRLSTGPSSPVYASVIEPLSNIDFVRNKTALFLIRDPRDILVSAYYSFGFTHSFSAVKEIREQQLLHRERVRSKKIDEFALESAVGTLGHFQLVGTLAQACRQGIVLKYEDMIDDWKKFSSGLTTYLDFNRRTLRRIYKRSRPLKKEDLTSHRRSGKPGDYKEKLQASTIETLNQVLLPVLTRFRYEV